ncbi:MAG TPA: carbohydrate porin [Candidatus Acidoferrum sp.]|nr:carbohydrate porin [Candidatus Acidoferrum sp.]
MKSQSEHPTRWRSHQREIRANTNGSPSQRRATLLYLQRLIVAAALALSLASITPAWAQNALPENQPAPSVDLLSRNYLLGDWGGERTALAEKGIVFDFFYIADLEANPSGGLEQTRAGWPRVRGTIDINFDRIISWQGFSFHATGLWQSGVNLGGKIGTLANPSDLVSQHATRLDSFWVQQLFLDNKIRVRAGQLAGLDFYGNQEYGGTWLIEPLGYAYGNLFSSIFESFNPAGTPGVEARLSPTKNFYVKSAVISGNRDPYHDDPTGFHFAIRNSPNFLFETGYVVSPENGMPSEADVGYITKSAGPTGRKAYPGLYKFGAVYNGGKFANPEGMRSSGNYLIYGMASQALFRSTPGSNRGLDVTFGFDYSPGDVSRENVQITAGARINAAFERRPNDRIGIGFVYTKISDPFSDFGALLGGPRLGSEKAFELNYSIKVTPYLLVEPTFQYYANVGGNPALTNAPVLGFRTKVTF